MILSARDLFKEEEKKCGGKSYCPKEQRIEKYGKITSDIAYRIIKRVRWIGSNSLYDVEVLSRNEDGTYKRTIKGFWNETEPGGGNIIGKKYKGALEYANEYIQELIDNPNKAFE